MYVQQNRSSGTGGTSTYTYTIYKNGVKQDGTGGTVDTHVSIVGASATAGNAAFSLPVAPGDTLTLEAVGANSPSVLSMSACAIRFQATNDRQKGVTAKSDRKRAPTRKRP